MVQNLHEQIKNVMINKYFMFTEELKQDREQIREVTEKSDNAVIIRMGLSVQALTYSRICITLFLLVLLNLA